MNMKGNDIMTTRVTNSLSYRWVMPIGMYKEPKEFRSSQFSLLPSWTFCRISILKKKKKSRGTSTGPGENITWLIISTSRNCQDEFSNDHHYRYFRAAKASLKTPDLKLIFSRSNNKFTYVNPDKFLTDYKYLAKNELLTNDSCYRKTADFRWRAGRQFIQISVEGF